MHKAFLSWEANLNPFVRSLAVSNSCQLSAPVNGIDVPRGDTFSNIAEESSSIFSYNMKTVTTVVVLTFMGGSGLRCCQYCRSRRNYSLGDSSPQLGKISAIWGLKCFIGDFLPPMLQPVGKSFAGLGTICKMDIPSSDGKMNECDTLEPGRSSIFL